MVLKILSNNVSSYLANENNLFLSNNLDFIKKEFLIGQYTEDNSIIYKLLNNPYSYFRDPINSTKLIDHVLSNLYMCHIYDYNNSILIEQSQYDLKDIKLVKDYNLYFEWLCFKHMQNINLGDMLLSIKFYINNRDPIILITRDGIWLTRVTKIKDQYLILESVLDGIKKSMPLDTLYTTWFIFSIK